MRDGRVYVTVTVMSDSPDTTGARSGRPQGERLDGVMRRLKAQSSGDAPARKVAAVPVAPVAAKRLQLPPLMLGPDSPAPKRVLRLVAAGAAALCLGAVGVGAIGIANGGWTGAETLAAPVSADEPVTLAALTPPSRGDRPAAPASSADDAAPVAAAAPTADSEVASPAPIDSGTETSPAHVEAAAPSRPAARPVARILTSGATDLLSADPAAPVLAATGSAPAAPDALSGPSRAADPRRPDTAVDDAAPGVAAPAAPALAKGPGADALVAVTLPTAPGIEPDAATLGAPDWSAPYQTAGLLPPAPADDATPLVPGVRMVDDLRVNVAAPNGVAAALLDEAADRIAALGHRPPATGTVAFTVSQSHVRYFHPSDREAATLIAAELDAPLRDFTDYGAGEGLVEVWLSGTPSVVEPAAPSGRRAQGTRRAAVEERRIPLGVALGQIFGGRAEVSRNRTRGFDTNDRARTPVTTARVRQTESRATPARAEPQPARSSPSPSFSGSRPSGGGSISPASSGSSTGFSGGAKAAARDTVEKVSKSVSNAKSAAKNAAKDAQKAAKSSSKEKKSKDKSDRKSKEKSGKGKKD